MKQWIKNLINQKAEFNSKNYWENRYSNGGNSGDGSYGRLAEFKAKVINQFIQENQIKTAIEFGCGDGNQVSLIHYPTYLGFDVSARAIKDCHTKFTHDKTKSFIQYDGASFYNNFIKADLSLSLDVIYHIVEEKVYEKYLKDLFDASSNFVIIYSTDFDKAENAHVLHRKFTDFVKRHIPSFELIQVIPNSYIGSGEQESEASFFIYKK